MSSGSEVALVLEAREKLQAEGIRARVVSMPSHEIFAAQEAGYRESVLPRGVKRISIEAGHPMSWQRWVGCDGIALGIDRFGASAPYKEIYEHLGLTVERLVETARDLIASRD
jgi:transketolase